MTVPELDDLIGRLERNEIEPCAPQWGQGLFLAYIWAKHHRNLKTKNRDRSK